MSYCAKKYFKTRIGAEINLWFRRKSAHREINKKDWKILDDRSFVYFDCISKKMWTNMLLITTDKLIEELIIMGTIDCEAELGKILKTQIGN